MVYFMFVCSQCKSEILKEEKEFTVPTVSVSTVKKKDTYRRW